MSKIYENHMKYFFHGSSPELVSKPEDLGMGAGKLCEQIVTPQAGNEQAIFYIYITFFNDVLLWINLPGKQDIMCHTPGRSWSVFEGCVKLQQVKSVQGEAKRKNDRLEPEAMAQTSRKNC